MKDMTRIINRIMESQKTRVVESKVGDELVHLTHKALVDLDHGDKESAVVKKYAPEYKKLGVGEEDVRKMFKSYEYDEPSEEKAQDLVNSLTESKASKRKTEAQSTVEPQTTVGVNPVPVLSQCHACMGIYRGDPRKCPICGAPADRSVKVKESKKNRRYTEARKAMTAKDFAEWHKNPENYRGKDAQVKMDKIYSILDRSHTTSDDIYDQYNDLPEKDKEEVTRLVYNESKDEDKIKVEVDDDFKDKVEECDQAVNLLECGDIEKFNEKYGTSTLSKDGKLQILVESTSGRRKIIERKLNSTQRAAFRISESARSLRSSVDPKKVKEYKKVRIAAILRNESKATRVAALRALERFRAPYDFKKIKEAIDSDMRDRLKETDARIDKIIEESLMPEDTISLITDIIKDTGLNVVYQQALEDETGINSFQIRVQDEPGVEVNLKELSDVLSDAMGSDVAIVGPTQVAGDSTLVDFVVLINPVVTDLQENSNNVAMSESLESKIKKESKNDDSEEEMPPKLTERRRVKEAWYPESSFFKDPDADIDYTKFEPEVKKATDGKSFEWTGEDDTGALALLSKFKGKKVVNKPTDNSLGLVQGEIDGKPYVKAIAPGGYEYLLKIKESKRRRRRIEDLSHGDGEKVQVKEIDTLNGIDSPCSKGAIDSSEILIESIEDMDEDELIKVEEALKKARNHK